MYIHCAGFWSSRGQDTGLSIDRYYDHDYSGEYACQFPAATTREHAYQYDRISDTYSQIAVENRGITLNTITIIGYLLGVYVFRLQCTDISEFTQKYFVPFDNDRRHSIYF